MKFLKLTEDQRPEFGENCIFLQILNEKHCYRVGRLQRLVYDEVDWHYEFSYFENIIMRDKTTGQEVGFAFIPTHYLSFKNIEVE